MLRIPIAGYLVVRLPKWNYDAAGRGVYRKKVPRLGNVLYEGIDRMGWFDVDEDYYKGSLPEPFRSERELIKNENADLTGILVTKDLTVAQSLLDYSDRERNEIISVRSPTLVQLKGEGGANQDTIHWIGYDVVDLGHWSLLSEGLFVAAQHFPTWQSILNEHGLLRRAEDATLVISNYKVAASRGGLQELAPSVYGIEAIEIGRVLHSI